MTTAEIKARLDQCKAQMEIGEVVYRVDHNWALRTIETLLARQAEVLNRLPEPPDGYMSDTQYARAELGADIRAIINPENET